MSYIGKKVVIPPGTEFFTNIPKHTWPRVLNRVYRVTILFEGAGEKPYVQWRYRGNYWAWTHPDNVRVIDPPSFLDEINSKIDAERKARI